MTRWRPSNTCCHSRHTDQGRQTNHRHTHTPEAPFYMISPTNIRFAFLVCAQAPSTPILHASLRLFPTPSNSAAITIVGHRWDTANLLLPLSTSHLTCEFTPSIRLPVSTRFYLIPLFPSLMDICAPMATHDPGYARCPSRHSHSLFSQPCGDVSVLSRPFVFLLVPSYIWN
ncbi:hypothetical protein K439DRAFT_829738 [Ramaria rubella]|nr:hypothetical protein K439DRAFT_829738 [Ramaria rubella]